MGGGSRQYNDLISVQGGPTISLAPTEILENTGATGNTDGGLYCHSPLNIVMTLYLQGGPTISLAPTETLENTGATGNTDGGLDQEISSDEDMQTPRRLDQLFRIETDNAEYGKTTLNKFHVFCQHACTFLCLLRKKKHNNNSIFF